jgi:hypothetical protein|uniref:Uncharacterized protein n=1 Tax=Ignisphaera aggregans TaxID=334771 RepID=A0A7J2U4L1_9CREN
MKLSRRFLDEASKSVEPIHAQGFFYVSRDYISYYLVFDYYDPLEYYNTIASDEQLFDAEVSKLWANMQQFLDSEVVKVNDVKVSPKVVMIDIGFRKNKKNPYIVFLIRFKAPIKTGKNIYENVYESEVVEYDYVAYWVFPPGSKILRVDFGVGEEEWDVVKSNVLAIYGRRGMKTSGYELIEFEIVELP